MKKEPNFRNSMKISSLLLATAFTAFAVPANATGLGTDGNDNMSIQETQQTKTVTGTVIDAAGIPVIGANVLVKGTTNGTITDIDGNFTLEVSSGDVLEISYIGYVTQELPVGNKSQFNVTLAEDTQALDEVVVVGYGTMRKSDVTGSISTESLVTVRCVNQTLRVLSQLPRVKS